MSTAKTETATKKMYATRDFNDAGTEKAFLAGKIVEADDATLANYAAAGLVVEESQASKVA